MTESLQVLRLRRDDAFGVHAQAGAPAAVRAARGPPAEFRVQEIVRGERASPVDYWSVELSANMSYTSANRASSAQVKSRTAMPSDISLKIIIYVERMDDQWLREFQCREK